MPTHNDTDTSSDYQVNNPPPNYSFAMLSLGTAGALAGATGLLAAAGRDWGGCLTILLYLLTLAGLGLVIAGARTTMKHGLCNVKKNVRYPLPPGQFSPCPNLFTVGDTVTFYEQGTENVLATSAPLSHPHCLVRLKREEARGRDGDSRIAEAGAGFSVEVTPSL